MELYVKVTLQNKEVKRAPIYYIRRYEKFEIDCIIEFSAIGMIEGEGLFATYDLKLYGDPGNVIDYWVYLKNNGFEVKKNAVVH